MASPCVESNYATQQAACYTGMTQPLINFSDLKNQRNTQNQKGSAMEGPNNYVHL